MAAHHETNNTTSEDLSTTNKALLAGASAVQDFAPVKSTCAHLNAFHVYASDPTRFVEANHYCGHLNEDVRQCILYDSPRAGARIIGIEYMATPSLYATLPQSERRLWHSHVFEVKSGMLVMPQPPPAAALTAPSLPLPQAAWEAAETKEMEQVVHLYGKVYHLWQVDRGDKLPLGEPQLMTSFTEEGQLDAAGGFEKIVGERDQRLGTDWRRKREIREGIEVPKVHADADWAWKK